jgi:hypothetical protein
MNEALIAGLIGLGIFVGFSISVIVKIQAIQKMRETNSTPLLGVVMPQVEATNEKKRGK